MWPQARPLSILSGRIAISLVLCGFCWLMALVPLLRGVWAKLFCGQCYCSLGRYTAKCQFWFKDACFSTLTFFFFSAGIWKFSRQKVATLHILSSTSSDITRDRRARRQCWVNGYIAVMGVVVGCSGGSKFGEKSRMKVGKENRSQHMTAKGRVKVVC